MKNNLTYKGIIKGINMPMLPNKLNSIYNNIFFRILRAIGGFSLVLVLTSKYLGFPNFFQILFLILASFQVIQMFFFLVIKTIFGVYLLICKPEQFKVRKSPFYIHTYLTNSILF